MTKMGPKGQVVIPKIFRESMGIAPGADVVMGFEENKVIVQKPAAKIEEVAERIAKKGKSVRMSPSEMRYMEIKEKWKLT